MLMSVADGKVVACLEVRNSYESWKIVAQDRFRAATTYVQSLSLRLRLPKHLWESHQTAWTPSLPRTLALQRFKKLCLISPDIGSASTPRLQVLATQ